MEWICVVNKDYTWPSVNSGWFVLKITFKNLGQFHIYRKIVKMMQRVPIFWCPVFHMISSLLSCGIFVTTNEPVVIYYYELKSILYSNVLYFLSDFLFSSWIPSKTLHDISSCYDSINSYGLWQLLKLFLFFITLAVWGVLVRYFLECPSTEICPTVFSWLDWRHGFWAGRPQKCHSHHICSVHTISMTYHCWC